MNGKASFIAFLLSRKIVFCSILDIIYIKHARPSRLDRYLDASCYAAVAEMGCRLPLLTYDYIITLCPAARKKPPPETSPCPPDTSDLSVSGTPHVSHTFVYERERRRERERGSHTPIDTYSIGISIRVPSSSSFGIQGILFIPRHRSTPPQKLKRPISPGIDDRSDNDSNSM